ncbi:uncharacterized protein FOMMEDRAFT_19868 [Fomitiporia mediterranea MF3/22]|uniref:uncharacterized protein n=1 Tax=Fomitiporia mediterranea (strain MF3/22) TaxID=694068 RepID=UPI0004407363|nr:uncharacterized protein FOMMEDRAFT_19868 [Fomitiporia mediterranea MF3/22]EJD04659.1 hypothetical protein FOMMEDRAFT_19868 [Fomitiporia mediterranea MF3/22]
MGPKSQDMTEVERYQIQVEDLLRDVKDREDDDPLVCKGKDRIRTMLLRMKVSLLEEDEDDLVGLAKDLFEFSFSMIELQILTWKKFEGQDETIVKTKGAVKDIMIYLLLEDEKQVHKIALRCLVDKGCLCLFDAYAQFKLLGMSPSTPSFRVIVRDLRKLLDKNGDVREVQFWARIRSDYNAADVDDVEITYAALCDFGADVEIQLKNIINIQAEQNKAYQDTGSIIETFSSSIRLAEGHVKLVNDTIGENDPENPTEHQLELIESRQNNRVQIENTTLAIARQQMRLAEIEAELNHTKRVMFFLQRGIAILRQEDAVQKLLVTHSNVIRQAGNEAAHMLEETRNQWYERVERAVTEYSGVMNEEAQNLFFALKNQGFPPDLPDDHFSLPIAGDPLNVATKRHAETTLSNKKKKLK